jgi:hypothetical protein
MTDNQTFKLTGPAGDVIMTGSMSAIMERLPDTTARNDALSTMLDTAVKQVEAEERAEEARTCAAQILADGITHLTTRLDAYEKQRALSMKRAEAQRKARDAARVQRMLDQLPDPDDPDDLYPFDPKEREASQDQNPEGVIPTPVDPTGASLKDTGLEGSVAFRQTPDPEDLGIVPDPKQVSQPISISLNEA